MVDNSKGLYRHEAAEVQGIWQVVAFVKQVAEIGRKMEAIVYRINHINICLRISIQCLYLVEQILRTYGTLKLILSYFLQILSPYGTSVQNSLSQIDQRIPVY